MDSREATHAYCSKVEPSFSKAYSLISRYSEDIDVTVFRDDLGHGASVEELEALSRKKRQAKLDAIKDACRDYTQRALFPQLSALAIDALSEARIDRHLARMVIDDQDPEGQTILFWYPSLTGPPDTYVRPAVKIESGAKSALEPHCTVTIRPDVSREVSGNLTRGRQGDNRRGGVHILGQSRDLARLAAVAREPRSP